MSATLPKRIAGPHSGANTHHHDQVIKLVSFKMIKTMASRLKKLKPDDELDDVLILFLCV